MPRLLHIATIALLLAGYALASDAGDSQTAGFNPLPTLLTLSGQVVIGDGTPIPGATVEAGPASTTADLQGNFLLSLGPGDYKLQVSAQGLAPLTVPISITSDTQIKIQVGASSTVTVVANADDLASDPSTQVYSADELVAASPGLPGMPVSLPGFPSETASGGVKAPQYFAPGVAGDHGEPIAQYIQIGDFLFQNNLPANAHGNGYADPNLLIPAAIGNVATDAGAFDVRHGNNAVNLAVAYGLRPRLEPFAEFNGDMHDYDFVTGWSPANPQTGAWVGVEIAGGNGFLALPENRKQYKINGERSFTFGRHQLTLFGAGYYGFSHIPGNHESAGKRLRGTTRQGSPWLRRMACQCAWAAARTKNTYLSSQFRRLAARRGKKRAIIAVAHTLIVIGYHLQKNQSNYDDLGGNYFDRIHSDGLKRYLVKRLQQLGHKVTLEPTEAA